MRPHHSLIALTTAITSAPIVAQQDNGTAPESPGYKLEEVIVTAQKREQSLQDVPMSVTAIAGDILSKNEIDGIEELTRLVPSLRWNPGGDGNSSFRVRGVGTNVFSLAVEANVSVVVDEVPLSSSGLASFDFADVQRVEVLRGPQGTLFGKNASAGLIHVITKDPADEFEAEIKANYERPDTLDGDKLKTQFNISGPITDKIGYRVSTYGTQESSYIRNLETGKNIDDSHTWGARGKLQWDFSSALDMRFNLEHQVRRITTAAIVWGMGHPEFRERARPQEFGPDSIDTRSSGSDPSDRITTAGSLKLNWDLGDFSLTSITALRKANLVNGTTAFDLDGDRVDLKQGGETSLETFTQEIRLTSPNGDRFEYSVGLLWYDNYIETVFGRTISDLPVTFVGGLPNPPNLEGLPIGIPDSLNVREFSDRYVDNKNLGIFGQATWHIGGRWHLTFGARHIDEELSTEVTAFNNIEDPTTGMAIPVASTSFTGEKTTISDRAVTGTLSLQYDWAEHSVIYTTVATGYRGKAFDNRPDQEALDKPVDPERSTSFELGIKSRLFDGRLDLNVVVFDTTFEDFQAQVLDFSETTGTSIGTFRLANAGELQTRGVEIEFNSRLTEAFGIYGAISYTDAVFNEFVTQCFTGQQPGEQGGTDLDGNGSCDAQDVSGGVLPNAPKISYVVTGRYDHVFSSGHNAFGQLGWQWQDDVQFTAEQHPNTIEEAYGTLNLKVGWMAPQDLWQATAYVNNLLAENHRVLLLPVSLANDRRDVVQVRQPSSDRVFGVSLTRRF